MSTRSREQKRRLAILRDEPLPPEPSREWPWVAVLAACGVLVGAMLVDGIYDGDVYRQYVGVFGEVSWWPVRVPWLQRGVEALVGCVEWLARWCAGDWPLDSVPGILRLAAAAEIAVGIFGVVPRVVREELADDGYADKKTPGDSGAA